MGDERLTTTTKRSDPRSDKLRNKKATSINVTAFGLLLGAHTVDA